MRGDGFPFDRPMLDLYNRCHRALRAVESLLLHPSRNKTANRALTSLHTILISVRCQVPFGGLARIIETRARLFDELRETLRITPKCKPDSAGVYRIGRASDDQARQAVELQDVETALKALEQSLRNRRPERGPAQDLRDAIDVILEHIEAQDLEQMPAEAFLALNLEKQDYLAVVFDGKIENLPAAFAALDADNRSQSLPVRLKTSFANEDVDIVSSSLSTSDRNLVRTSEWQQRVRAEAKSRAPLRRAAEKQ